MRDAPIAPPSSLRTPLAGLWHDPWVRITLIGLGGLLLWDLSPLDGWLAQAFGDGQGFALRDHWFFKDWLHAGGQKLSWALVLGLVLALRWPVGVLRALPRARRGLLLLGLLAPLLAITLLKHYSRTSCPWDLDTFGGSARYVSHWALGVFDGGGGHCFPAGHASAGFAFVSGYFVLQPHQPRAARWWLAACLAAGLLLGLGQQVRGAHFMSHTLWTAWLCWTVAGVAVRGAGRFKRFSPAAALTPPDRS